MKNLKNTLLIAITMIALAIIGAIGMADIDALTAKNFVLIGAAVVWVLSFTAANKKILFGV